MASNTFNIHQQLKYFHNIIIYELYELVWTWAVIVKTKWGLYI